MIKIPKYIEKELEKASEYANKSHRSIDKFMEWVINNVDEDFDFDYLRAWVINNVDEDFDFDYLRAIVDDISKSTEALTEIEYGNEVDIGELERVLNI